jgi:hypothetical protein
MDCNIILENGEMVEMEKGNQIINEIIGCLKGRDLTVLSAGFLLDESKKEIERITKV